MYYSQYNQDKILNEMFFKNAKNGVFIDIGAHDGECFSNSLFFEKELNWTGLCIEPNPKVFEELKNKRKSICINKAIYNKKGKIPFSKNSGRTELLSGIVETYDEQHKERITQENNIYGGETEIIEVECDLLENILEEYNINIIDYFSIDTEGSEWNIISTINFDKVKINILDVEINYPDSVESKNIIEKLLANNFKLLGQLGPCDLIFENNDLKFSYA